MLTFVVAVTMLLATFWAVLAGTSWMDSHLGETLEAPPRARRS